ncbi:hypothetical protein CRENBAI_019467 [Crenichthys baileyi]|uniref:Uncharacterized protein n=1 Tax=Crenichthys baileyi TaxID=28760 RepID=A0AAV9RQX5_9TELE
MLPARLHSGVLRYTNPGPRRRRQESARDRWVQQQMEEAMRHLPADLEVLPSPLLLEHMEREAVQRPSPPSSLVAHPDPAAKPASFSRHRKRRRRAFPYLSASEEEAPMATAVTSGAVVSLPAASIPASSSATAPSPRLVVAPPMPSSLAPVRGSVAMPEELEEPFGENQADGGGLPDSSKAVLLPPISILSKTPESLTPSLTPSLQSSTEFLEGPLRSMLDLLICRPEGPLLCSADLHSSVHSTPASTVSTCLLESSSPPSPAAKVSTSLLAFLSSPSAAGLQGLYVSVGLHVSATGRQGLYVSVGLHVSAADRQGLQVLVLAFIATAGLHVFANVAGHPGS